MIDELCRVIAELPPNAIERMAEDDARLIFQLARWPQTCGLPVCPACESTEVHKYVRAGGVLWRCDSCRAEFTEISGTPFAYSKLRRKKVLEIVRLLLTDISVRQAAARAHIGYKWVWRIAGEVRTGRKQDDRSTD